jgi:hypothetical protein
VNIDNVLILSCKYLFLNDMEFQFGILYALLFTFFYEISSYLYGIIAIFVTSLEPNHFLTPIAFTCCKYLVYIGDIFYAYEAIYEIGAILNLSIFDSYKLSLFISFAFNINVCLLSDVTILILSIVYCKLNVCGSGFYDSIYILKYHIPDIASSIVNS